MIHDHWDWKDHNVDVLVQTRAQAELEKAESNDVGGDAPDIEQEHSPSNQNDEEGASSISAQEAKETSKAPPSKSRKRKRIIDKDRRQGPPIASWIGKQILNQQIPVRQRSYLNDLSPTLSSITPGPM